MNLLFTLTAYPPFMGGAQLLMHQLARHFLGRHRVQAVTQWDAPRNDWLLGTTLNAPRPARDYEYEGVPVHRLTLEAGTRRRLAPWVLAYYLVQGWALTQVAEALAAQVEPFAQSAELVHNCRIGREGLSYASWQVARARGLPFVFTPVHHPRWGGWLHRHYHHLYRQADAVIALTQAEARTLAALGVDERRVFVTGMGPVLAESGDGRRFRERHGLGDDPLVLFVGQKYAYKGLELLLAAAPRVWERYPDVRFVFIGPRTAYSRRLFGSVSEPRLLELDTVDVQEKTDAYAACDLFCLPSTQESFGGVFTEAWSLGKPVIGADIPSVRAVIDEGQDGCLVPPQAGALAERLVYLLGRPAERAQLGERGRAKVAASYTWPKLAERTEHVYRAVLEGRL